MATADRRDRFKKMLREHLEQARSVKRRFSNGAILIFAGLFLLVEGLIYLHANGIVTLPARLVDSWHILIRISIAFLIASVASRIINFLFFKTLKDELEIEKRLFYGKLWSFTFYLAAIVFTLYQLGVKQDNITIFAGFIATGFALSMREMILSYLVWMVLLFKRPFRIGDIIKVGDDEGLVEHIGTFYVKLSDGSGDPERCTRLPTKQFLEKPIQNYGTADFLEQFRITIPSETDADKLVKETKAIVQKESGAKENVMINLEADALGSIKLVIVYPIIFEKRRTVRTAIIAKVQRLIAPKKK